MQKKKEANKSSAGPIKRKKQALGRGLGALIPEMEKSAEPPRDFFYCDIERIQPNRFQPRQQFPEAELEELSQSIKEQGILQPLLVREENDAYELIAGERRLRAAKRAGLTQVPVIIKRITDSKLLELSIVENIQRANLNPMEESEAYHRLIIEFHLTQDEAATRVGKSRSTVANFLRLRQLPEAIRTSIQKGDLSMGHARALLGTPNPTQQLAAWRSVVKKGLSVRETEDLVRALKGEKKKPKVSRKSVEDHYLLGLAEELSRHFGTKVTIKRRGLKGKVEIEFYSNDDLDRLIGRLQQTKF
ncbi:MAG: ParB/RepB/Spo0J family partition protein [Deltaproteobacteria bacterium]|jgi:ParB family chromosome partitioning protein|nr:ParB/RepB/Spo0J family partition protein [Deltaproteobacteria bacterium]MBW2485837.1 ParB/RepB/Spo0J family partition protein [Deltaproteobacteria bacterium]